MAVRWVASCFVDKCYKWPVISVIIKTHYLWIKSIGCSTCYTSVKPSKHMTAHVIDLFQNQYLTNFWKLLLTLPYSKDLSLLILLGSLPLPLTEAGSRNKKNKFFWIENWINNTVHNSFIIFSKDYQPDHDSTGHCKPETTVDAHKLCNVVIITWP